MVFEYPETIIQAYDPGRARSRTGSRTTQPTGSIALAAIATCLGACQGSDPGELQAAADPLLLTAAPRGEHGRRCDWEQWGQGPEHEGAACEEVDHFHRISAHLTFDPFVDQELADTAIQHDNIDLFVHYQSPLLVSDEVYMEFKAGTYTSCASVAKGAPCGRAILAQRRRPVRDRQRPRP
ncbi:MAG TPA: hypothetical protein VHN14_16195 [Kofleriaceae bacterium]|nr:hypothetical protein [Kofleriaceae bacterium]